MSFDFNVSAMFLLLLLLRLLLNTLTFKKKKVDKQTNKRMDPTKSGRFDEAPNDDWSSGPGQVLGF